MLLCSLKAPRALPPPAPGLPAAPTTRWEAETHSGQVWLSTYPTGSEVVPGGTRGLQIAPASLQQQELGRLNPNRLQSHWGMPQVRLCQKQNAAPQPPPGHPQRWVRAPRLRGHCCAMRYCEELRGNNKGAEAACCLPRAVKHTEVTVPAQITGVISTLQLPPAVNRRLALICLLLTWRFVLVFFSSSPSSSLKERSV